MGESAESMLTIGGGVVRAGVEDPARRDRAYYLAEKGELCRVLPGVFIHPDAINRPAALARAVTSYDPNAIVTGRAAAALTYWPELDVSGLDAVTTTDHTDSDLIRFTRRTIPEELICNLGEVRVTSPALTALDLCTGELGAQAMDRVLQLGHSTVPELRRALDLTPGRPGNDIRRRLLRDVKSGGCSPLERDGHALLRQGGLTNWVANKRILIAGVPVVPDLRFRDRMLVIEFDGFTYHSSREAFERDRGRQNLLVSIGYLVLRFTAAMLAHPLEVLRLIRQAYQRAPLYP